MPAGGLLWWSLVIQGKFIREFDGIVQPKNSTTFFTA
jgi:hypothetical protein